MIFLIIVLYNTKNLKLSPLILSQYSIPEKNGGRVKPILSLCIVSSCATLINTGTNEVTSLRVLKYNKHFDMNHRSLATPGPSDSNWWCYYCCSRVDQYCQHTSGAGLTFWLDHTTELILRPVYLPYITYIKATS